MDLIGRACATQKQFRESVFQFTAFSETCYEKDSICAARYGKDNH